MYKVFIFTFLILSLNATKKPNIIMFLVDDMGWQDTSVPFWKEKTPFNKTYRTPNMETLASQGMKFTSAYACNVCSPTRISLMTGLNAARHRVTDWTLNKVKAGKVGRKGRGPMTPPMWNANGLCPEAGLPLSVHAKSLPKYLQEAGYRTIHAGKAHFAAVGTPAADPKKMGFDINIAGHAAGAPANYLGMKNFARNPAKPGSSIWDVPGLDEYHGKDIFLTEALTLEANKAMDQAVKDNKPFFLYMAHYAIHTPLIADKRFIERYQKMGLHPKEAMYAALIEGMDESLGDLMANVEKLGLTKNTVILFMSDNGGLSAIARGGKKHMHNLPLKSGKGSVNEGGIRVPMIAKWPGVTKKASVCDEPLIIEDFFSTILELAGVKNPQQIGGVIDGISFVPLLKGKPAEFKKRPLVFHYPNNWGPTGPGINFISAMRNGKWKLIAYHDKKRNKNRFELYDLEADIQENNDLFDKYPEVLSEMKKELKKQLSEMGAQMPLLNGKPVQLPIK